MSAVVEIVGNKFENNTECIVLVSKVDISELYIVGEEFIDPKSQVDIYKVAKQAVDWR